MNKSVYVHAGLLALSLGAAWYKYTAGEDVVKEGVQLVDAKADALEKVVYTTPELTVTLEMKTDDFGRYGWVTVEDRKKKAADDAAPVEPKTTKFKMGTAGDKVVEFFTPLYALRKLDAADDTQLTAFGLKEPDTTLSVAVAGRTLDFDLGGETYGSKDRYARDKATGTLYVLDDEQLKSLKMAATRLPERALTAAKVEKIGSASLGVGGATGAWTQKNKEDKAAAYWERDGAGKDESFDNWLEKALKLKSTAYVQDGEAPAELLPAFDLTLRVDGEKAETVSLLQGGEDWYAKSESTRGLVKLSRGAAKDVVEDAKDVAEGRAPAPEEKPPAAPGGPPPGAPAGMPGAPPSAPPPAPPAGQ